MLRTAEGTNLMVLRANVFGHQVPILMGLIHHEGVSVTLRRMSQNIDWDK